MHGFLAPLAGAGADSVCSRCSPTCAVAAYACSLAGWAQPTPPAMPTGRRCRAGGSGSSGLATRWAGLAAPAQLLLFAVLAVGQQSCCIAGPSIKQAWASNLPCAPCFRPLQVSKNNRQRLTEHPPRPRPPPRPPGTDVRERALNFARTGVPKPASFRPGGARGQPPAREPQGCAGAAAAA